MDENPEMVDHPTPDSLPQTGSVIGEPSPDPVALNIPLWVVMLGMLIVMAVVFWSTLGMRTTGLIEEWHVYQKFDQVGITTATLSQVAAPNRLVVTLAEAIAYLLAPNSFTGLQILGLLMFIANGFALFGIVRQLIPKVPVIAFMSAILFVVYPAETGWFNSRYCAYSFLLLMYLFAVYLFLIYWQRPRWWLIIGFWVPLFLCLGTTESAFPLVFATPLILIWLQKGVSRRMLRVAALWYVVPVAMALFTAYVLSLMPGNYQSSLLSAYTDPPATRLLDYISYELHAYQHIFWGGWADLVYRLRIHAVTYFTAASALILPLLLLSVAIIGGILRQTRRSTQSAARSVNNSRLHQFLDGRTSYVVLFLIGLVVIGLGFIVYVPLQNYRMTADRVYVLSSIGGALCCSLILYGLSTLARRFQAPVLALLFAFVFGLAGLGAFGRIVGLRYDSGQEQLALAQIVQQMPKVPDGTPLVIFDKTKRLTTTLWDFGIIWNGDALTAALRFLYHEPQLTVHLCYPEQTVDQIDGVCQLTPTGIQFSAMRPDEPIPYNKLIAFDYQPDQGYTLLSTLPDSYRTAQNSAGFVSYNPYALVDTHALPPPRVYTLLESWPYFPFRPRSLFPQRSIAVNMAEVNDAPGGEVFVNPLLSDGWTNGSWTSATSASLHVLLAQGTDYHLSFQTGGSFLPEIASSVTFSVNGQPIPLTKTDNGNGLTTFTGTIPQAVINRNPTDTLLVFNTDRVVTPESLGLSSELRTFGVNVGWLHIDPVGTP